MRELVTALALLFIANPALAAIPINPTTTLSAETSSNTSAANTFKTQSNGNMGATNVSKLPTRELLYGGATTKIYAHLMPWFGPPNHISVGYDSADPAQVKRQVVDMVSRGIDGAIVDWYGPLSTHHHTATLHLMHEAELHPGFEFAITEDVGAVKDAADSQQKLISDLNFVHTTFTSSPAYMRRGGRPVIFFFGLEAITSIDWDVVRSSVLGNPLFIFRNSGAFTKPQTNGGFAWLQNQTTVTANYMSLGYLDNFYTTALSHPTQETFGSAFKGFDDTLAAWGSNRKIKQFCGQTWLSSMAEAGKFYNSSKQLESLQIVTWNDYEEGSEIETGIDNCLSISASVAGSTLSWKVTGDEKTIARYTVFISSDGKNLMPLVDVAPGNRSLNLGSFDLAPGSFTFYVKAVGKPSILNHISNAAKFPADLSIAVAPASLMVKQGLSGNLTVTVTPQGASFDSPISFSCSSLPAQSRCVFAPPVVTPGAQAATTTLTLLTNGAVATRRLFGNYGPLYAVWLAGAGIVGVVLAAPKSKRPKQRYFAAVVLLLALAMLQVACGGTGAKSSSETAAKTGTFLVVITGTSGSQQVSTTANVTVH